jgi:hypothetical protein
MMFKTSISTDYISILMLQSLFDAKFGQKSTAADASSPALLRQSTLTAWARRLSGADGWPLGAVANRSAVRLSRQEARLAASAPQDFILDITFLHAGLVVGGLGALSFRRR